MNEPDVGVPCLLLKSEIGAALCDEEQARPVFVRFAFCVRRLASMGFVRDLLWTSVERKGDVDDHGLRSDPEASESSGRRTGRMYKGVGEKNRREDSDGRRDVMEEGGEEVRKEEGAQHTGVDGTTCGVKDVWGAKRRGLCVRELEGSSKAKGKREVS